jgi:hypothetical protein
MPYEITLNKKLTISDRDQYFNDCCVGGDQIQDLLLPSIRAQYTHVMANQEDWGWFIWFRSGALRLALDIHTEDSDAVAFKIHLYSQKSKFLIFTITTDTPELERLKDSVLTILTGWAENVTLRKTDAQFN